MIKIHSASGTGQMLPCDIDSFELRLDNIPLPGYPLMYNEGFVIYSNVYTK